jgi:hypothetical protein
MVGSDELLGHKSEHGVEHDTSRPDGAALGDMLTMLQERVQSKKAAAAAAPDAGATALHATADQDQLVTTASAATAAAMAPAPRRRIIAKTVDKSKNVIINGGPPAGAAPIVIKFGCSKCRGGKKGCIQCRNPNFEGKRFTKV